MSRAHLEREKAKAEAELKSLRAEWASPEFKTTHRKKQLVDEGLKVRQRIRELSEQLKQIDLFA